MTANPFDQLPFLQQGVPGASPTATPTAADPLTQPIPAAPVPGPAATPFPMIDQPLLSPPAAPSPPTQAPPPAAPVAPARPETESLRPPVASTPDAAPIALDMPDPYSDDFDDLDDDAELTESDRGTRGSGFGSIVRRILGLDREPRKRPQPADSDWLDDDQNELPSTISVDPAPRRRPSNKIEANQVADAVTSDDADGRVLEAQQPAGRRARGRAASDTVAVSDGQRSWPAKAGRWAIWVVIALIFAAGVNQVILRPVFGSGAPDAVEQGPAVDLSAAQAAAIRYALDYFSYSPDTAAAGSAALRADVDSSTVKRWTGTGYLASDSAAAGPMVTVDDTTALVPVTLRIRLAMPPARENDLAAPASPTPLTGPNDDDIASPTAESAAPSSRPTPSAATAAPTVPGGAAGDPGQIPSGWTDLGSRWVTVSVPVRAAADGSVKATGGGAILVGESVTAAVGTVDPMADSDLSSSTNTAVDRFFTGYAASDTSYVSAPGVDMTGLNGVVTAGDRTRWSADLPATTSSDSTTPKDVSQLTGTAGVTWQLTGTDLAIVQTYRAAMTLSQGRWYVAQLAPSFTNQ